MKSLITLLSFATQIAMASGYKMVVISECIQANHIEVNMLDPKGGWGGATLVLKGLGKDFEKLTVAVDAEKSFLAACDVQIEKSGEDVLANVSFDADLEDGRNACFVNIQKPNGKTLTAELYIDVIDF